MIPTSFIAPLRDNDGNMLPRTVEQQLRARMLDIGGWTAMPCEGEWRDKSGVTYHDSSLRYEVSLASWDQIPALLDMLRWLCGAARQLEIFYTIAGIPSTMRGPAP